jgi:DNA invertase Pin-like site-specific DNA recombinase
LQQIDTTTLQGQLVFHLLAALDEFQRAPTVRGRQAHRGRDRGPVGGRQTIYRALEPDVMSSSAAG